MTGAHRDRATTGAPSILRPALEVLGWLHLLPGLVAVWLVWMLEKDPNLALGLMWCVFWLFWAAVLAAAGQAATLLGAKRLRHALPKGISVAATFAALAWCVYVRGS